MAAASDKARFFLEQSVPELNEYERKKIFTSPEISSIARQRSDFEHKINARGPTPSDFARYAEFEINVEALRKKRVQRLGIKSVNHTGQRRIFFVFDRGTKKHPADVGLWLQSIEYAKKQRAHKKIAQIFTNVLRLHPTRSELWIYASQFAMDEHGDITEARSYMQRGLRFCKSKRTMWIQYARLEMSYIAKIHARRQILGLEENEDEAPRGRLLNGEDEIEAGKDIVDVIETSQDNDVDEAALRKLESIPAQRGAIPIAIFDAALLHFNDDPKLAKLFVEMLSDFDQLPATSAILRHISDELRRKESKQWIVHACNIQLPLVGVPVDAVEYPGAFRRSLQYLKQARSTFGSSTEFDTWSRNWLRKVLEEDDLDPALRTVASAIRDSV